MSPVRNIWRLVLVCSDRWLYINKSILVEAPSKATDHVEIFRISGLAYEGRLGVEVGMDK